VARNSSMESARIDHRKLFNQPRPNQGRPPDHDRPIHNI
jgi:hypothetical protein